VIVRTETGENLFESAMKANAIEGRPFATTQSSLEVLVKPVAKKKLQNNAYYIRRGVDNNRHDWLRNQRIMAKTA